MLCRTVSVVTFICLWSGAILCHAQAPEGNARSEGARFVFGALERPAIAGGEPPAKQSPPKDLPPACRLQLRLSENDQPIAVSMKAALTKVGSKPESLALKRQAAGLYVHDAVPPGEWRVVLTPARGGGAESYPIAVHQSLHFSRPGEYSLIGDVLPDPKRMGLRWLLLKLQDAPRGADVLPDPPNYKASGKPITIRLFLVQDDADPDRVAARLDQAHVGYPEADVANELRTWKADKSGKAAIDGLPVGEHILIAQPDAANATVVPISVPQRRGEHIKRLRPLPNWVFDPKEPRPLIEVKVEGAGEQERLLVTIKNLAKNPYQVSEYDLHLSSADWRVFPNGMADGQLPVDQVQSVRGLVAIAASLPEIPPGQSREFSLSWPDFVRQGLWIARREGHAERPLPDKDGRGCFRVGGRAEVWLTRPADLLKKSVSLEVEFFDAAGRPSLASALLRYTGKSDHANRILMLPSKSDPRGISRVFLPTDRGWTFTEERGAGRPHRTSESFTLEKPGHYAIELRALPVRANADGGELHVVVKQTPTGAKVVPVPASPADALPNPRPVEVPVPDRTPFDQVKVSREMYLVGYRDGYLWAVDPNRRTYCMTNPSEDNFPAIRGIIEGWRDGAINSKEPPGDLPAKYAKFIAVQNPIKKQSER